MVYTCDICGESIVAEEDIYSRLFCYGHSDFLVNTYEICRNCDAALYSLIDELRLAKMEETK